MCGRVIQSSGPLSYGIVEGMDIRDSRARNDPPRWNAVPGQDLLVIRRNHETGTVSLDPLRWGLIPHWCQDPTGGRKPINAKRGRGQAVNVQGGLPSAALHPAGRSLLRMEGDQGPESEAPMLSP
jgi:putative SOS response-associated peptidase YedK